MQIEYVPLLQTQRELHEVPRGMERFRHYIATITGDTDDVALPPLISMNPMGREHVAVRLDELIALGADAGAATAAAEAAAELEHVSGNFKVGQVVVDDLRGGWTNRYTADFGMRAGRPVAATQGWISVPWWVSETPTPGAVRAAVRAAIYRRAYMLRHGHAQTVRQIMAQEGLAAVFAGARVPVLSSEELAYSRDIIRAYLDDSDWPTVLPCLYGDPAAYQLGYPQLGLPQWAGFSLGIDYVQAYLQRTQRSAADAIDVAADELIAADQP